MGLTDGQKHYLASLTNLAEKYGCGDISKFTMDEKGRYIVNGNLVKPDCENENPKKVDGVPQPSRKRKTPKKVDGVRRPSRKRQRVATSSSSENPKERKMAPSKNPKKRKRTAPANKK